MGLELLPRSARKKGQPNYIYRFDLVLEYKKNATAHTAQAVRFAIGHLLADSEYSVYGNIRVWKETKPRDGSPQKTMAALAVTGPITKERRSDEPDTIGKLWRLFDPELANRLKGVSTVLVAEPAYTTQPLDDAYSTSRVSSAYHSDLE